ncbi:MAG TPA: hypothetical protein VE913_20150 [Longimicrobium sp.]|nr:hypothetical protein [Longimicrobium sp.]
MLKLTLLICGLTSLVGCDLVPYRIVPQETIAQLRENPVRPAPADSVALEPVTVDSGPRIPAFVDPGLLAQTMDTVTTTVVTTHTETQAVAVETSLTDTEMAGWLLWQKVRVPRSRREWTIEPGETAEFMVLDRRPMPEGGMVARVRFSVVDGEQRGLQVEGLLRYAYTETADGDRAVPIGFTPVRAERIGNW